MTRPPPTNERYSTERLAQQLMDSWEVCGDQVFYQASLRLMEQLKVIADMTKKSGLSGDRK